MGMLLLLRPGSGPAWLSLYLAHACIQRRGCASVLASQSLTCLSLVPMRTDENQQHQLLFVRQDCTASGVLTNNVTTASDK